MHLKQIGTRNWLCVAAAAAVLMVVLPHRAAAQYNDPPERVARLNYLTGSVSFQPAGEPDWVSAAVNRPMTTGDRLWADNNARAEMHFGSSTARLGAQTGMSFLNLDDRTTQIELSEGVLNIRVQRLDRDEIFEIDTPNQAFSILRPGQYRIEASEDGNSTMVTVRSGEGEVTGGGRTYTVGAGLTGSFTGNDSLRSAIYKSGGYDEFDTWGQGRDRHDDGVQSARYVSPDLIGYQDLDDYGYWQVNATYGNIWIPRVSASWAPYHDGHWVWISPWGWTWIDDAPWGYAPSHYGRWVNVSNNWGWVPGPIAVRPVYAPALVVFIGGPRFSISIGIGGGGGGNVGWFPLGPREVYVPSYQTSRAYVDRVNITNTTVNNVTITNVYNNSNNTNINYSNRNVRGGVTAVTQNTFVNAQPVGRSVIAVNPQEIASAPINRRAPVAPSKTSVLGGQGGRAVQPPPAVVNRTVIVKTKPPAPPVPFERQQPKLAAQPGRPLPSNEIETLRPAAATASPARVRQAPPGKPATADSNQPAPAPAGRGGNRGQQAAPPPTPAPANNTPATRNDRPSGNNGNGGNRGQQSAPAAAAPAPTDNTPARNDRPNRGRGQQPTTAQPPAATPAAPTPAPTGGNRGQQSAPAAAAPAPTDNTPARNDRPNRGRGQQPTTAQPPAATPAAPTPAPTGANRGQQPDTAQRPQTPAAPAPAGRGANRGQQPDTAARPPAAPAPAPAPAPPAGDSPAGRGANRGQQGRTPTPEAKPSTEVATPGSSNDSPGRGNRGR